MVVFNFVFVVWCCCVYVFLYWFLLIFFLLFLLCVPVMKIPRPITNVYSSYLLFDLLWADPASIEEEKLLGISLLEREFSSNVTHPLLFNFVIDRVKCASIIFLFQTVYCVFHSTKLSVCCCCYYYYSIYYHTWFFFLDKAIFGGNQRGGETIIFGKNAVERFHELTGCTHILRAHQSPKVCFFACPPPASLITNR